MHISNGIQVRPPQQIFRLIRNNHEWFARRPLQEIFQEQTSVLPFRANEERSGTFSLLQFLPRFHNRMRHPA